MAEELTFTEQMSKMLNNISDEYDKRETSLIYQSCAMIVPELLVIKSDLEYMHDEIFPDTCSYNNLVRFCKPKGIEPREATKGIVIADFDKEIGIGTRFNCENRNYYVGEYVGRQEEKYRYKLLAEETGHIESFGDLTPIDDVNIGTAAIKQIEKDGREAEDIDSLRDRYKKSLEYQSFGGNKADYIEKVMTMDNIGACKIFRRQKDGENVDIVILDSSFNLASSELVQSVQRLMAPEGTNTGDGLAPIGHTVLVTPASKETINIQTTVSLTSGSADIQRDIEKAIETYLYELRSTWMNDEHTVVRISHIENRILAIANVIDVNNTKINGYARNLTVDERKIPVLGSVSYVRG